MIINKIKLFIFFFLFISRNLLAQPDIKVYYEKADNGFKFFADNNEFCPVSVRIDFELDNLESTKGNHKVFVIPAKTKKSNFTDLQSETKGSYAFKFKSRYNYGDHLLNSYDKDYEYYLPFGKNTSYQVYQGYNGKSSHQNENALDFVMPVGTKVYAAREGIIIKVVDVNNGNCDRKDCAKFNNYITVLHPDGTFAEYTHIKKDGARVKTGDIIEKGQLIAESGNVGWSTGPHLHFVTFIQRLETRETLETKFLTGNGKKSEYLVENKFYSRSY